MKSQRLWLHTQDLHRFKADKLLWEREVETKHYHQKKMLFLINMYWEMENWLFSVEYHWLYKPHSRAGHLPRTIWATQNRLYHVLVVLFVSFCFIWVIWAFFWFWDICWLVYIFIFILFLRDRKRKRGGSLSRETDRERDRETEREGEKKRGNMKLCK